MLQNLEKEMATYSSLLAWRIPGTGQPGAAIYGVTQSCRLLKQLRKKQTNKQENDAPKSLWTVTTTKKLKYACSLEEKLWKIYISIKNQRHHFDDKVHIFKPMVFPLVMDGCKSWTIKKGEHLRTDAFELWCWRKLLRVPWTIRSSNQSNLKEFILVYSLEGLMLMLKLQYFGHLMERTESLEKALMLGKIESRRRRV